MDSFPFPLLVTRREKINQLLLTHIGSTTTTFAFPNNSGNLRNFSLAGVAKGRDLISPPHKRHNALVAAGFQPVVYIMENVTTSE